MFFLSGYGEIKYNDFIEYFTEHFYDPSRDEQLEVREAFREFDLNGDGYITREEFKTVMTQLGDGEEKLTDAEFKQMMREMFDPTDFNKDGKIDYEGKMVQT